jgi:hypothetical protein
LSDELVGGGNAEEDGERIKTSVDEVEEVKGDIPAATEEAEEKTKDKAKRVQGK